MGESEITGAKSPSEPSSGSLVERVIKLETALSFAKGFFTASGITVLVIFGGIGWLLTKANTLNSDMEAMKVSIAERKTEMESVKVGIAERKTELEAMRNQFKALTDDFGKIQTQLPHLAADEVKTAVTDPNGSFQRNVAELPPPHAVVAFNRADCPQPGWKPLPQMAGRVVVGSGSGNRDQNDKLLSARSFRQAAGEESHNLSSAELPTDIKAGFVGQTQISSPDAQDLRGWSFKTIIATAGGGGQSHNIMPPYYVLQYCEKM